MFHGCLNEADSDQKMCGHQIWLYLQCLLAAFCGSSDVAGTQFCVALTQQLLQINAGFLVVAHGYFLVSGLGWQHVGHQWIATVVALGAHHRIQEQVEQFRLGAYF